MVANGLIDAEYLNVESEHSAMAACIGAQATGVRTYTATCSQGLALMWELLYVASGMRLPIVMNVANRALSAPLNIWNDWSDSIGCRDSGWIQLYCETAQEALDTTIQAYKIAENKNVLLPVMVCIDGFYLSHIFEPVDVPESVKKFLGNYKPNAVLDPDNPITQGAYATPDYYQEFKEQQQIAMNRAKEVIQKANKEFSSIFNRKYGNGLFELFNMDSAKHAIVTMGTLAGTIKHILTEKKIKDIGLVRLRSYRPFPLNELEKILENVQSIGVLEKDVSLGLGGALWSELRAIKKPMAGFIGGLGGRDVKINDILNVFDFVRKKKQGVFWIGSKLR
jgi:pyruvate ferredoxin oxidoreductase alpha subunit